MPAPLRIVIDGVEYPCSKWETQDAQLLRQTWTRGFAGGMGSVVRRAADDYYYGRRFDSTTFPYLRLRPSTTASVSATNLNPANPCFWAEGQSGDGTNFIYCFNGTRSFKVNKDDNTLESTINHAGMGASDLMGRAALFESSFRVPRGGTENAATLTIGNPSVADTYTSMAVTALHFANLQDEGTAKLARAHTTNLVDLASVITPAAGDWSGDDFEAGDSSLAISDLLVSAGELIVINPSGPRRFDARGNSLPVQEFVGRNPNASAADGANSFGYGPYWYWVHSSGIWRGIGERMTQINIDSDPQWVQLSYGLGTPFAATSVWSSFTAFGRWAYATNTDELYVGYINDDGTVRWHGSMFSGTNLRCWIDSGAVLWIADGAGPNIRRVNLKSDGSPRTLFGTNRGSASDNHDFFLPEWDELPDRQKQLRKLWVFTEDMTGDGTDGFTLGVHRDGGSVQLVGSAITTSGYVERNPTVGTNDLFYRLLPLIRSITTAGYGPATSDPRIRAYGIEALRPMVCLATIPLVQEGVRGFSAGIEGALSNLRQLKDAQRVAIVEPETNTSFNGHVVGVREQVTGEEGDKGIGYIVTLEIERYDIPA